MHSLLTCVRLQYKASFPEVKPIVLGSVCRCQASSLLLYT